jgi:sec-independent protein translocase protein TatB
MLDVGFSEILLTSAIALIVLGPERLPKVARQVGNWMGRARAMARQLSEQLEREVSADELLKTQEKKSAPAADPPASANSGTRDTSFDSYSPSMAPVPAAATDIVTPGAAIPDTSAAPAAASPGTTAQSVPADVSAEPPSAPEALYGLPAEATTPAAMHPRDPLADPKPPHE